MQKEAVLGDKIASTKPLMLCKIECCILASQADQPRPGAAEPVTSQCISSVEAVQSWLSLVHVYSALNRHLSLESLLSPTVGTGLQVHFVQLNILHSLGLSLTDLPLVHKVSSSTLDFRSEVFSF